MSAAEGLSEGLGDSLDSVDRGPAWAAARPLQHVFRPVVLVERARKPLRRRIFCLGPSRVVCRSSIVFVLVRITGSSLSLSLAFWPSSGFYQLRQSGQLAAFLMGRKVPGAGSIVSVARRQAGELGQELVENAAVVRLQHLD